MTPPASKPTSWLKTLVFSGALGAGLLASPATAQNIIEVAGDGFIGDEALTSSALPVNVGSTFTADGGTGFSNSVLKSPTVAVTADGPVTLNFDHRYFIEAGWDGAAVFVSVNGAPATYVPGTDFTAEGYVGNTLANTPNTAWEGGEDVFYGTSTGYATPSFVTSTATLGTLTTGDTVSVEFHIRWDGAYFEPDTNWEIASVQITDVGATILNTDFAADGPSGFTVINSDPAPVGPFVYTPATNVFEIDADTLDADRYAPNVVGSAIDLNNASIEVEVLAGTLDAGDSFTLFDLSSGTTLTGSIGSLTLPPGIWDTSTTAVDGKIVLQLPPASGGGTTPGSDFLLDASQDTDTGDGRAPDFSTDESTGFDGLLDDSPLVTQVAVSSTATPKITSAYDVPGGSTGADGGILPVDAGQGAAAVRSFQEAPGDWTNEDVTIEIWLKPDSLTPINAANTNGQLIFEDGGGTGFGFFLDDSGEMQLRKAPGGGIVSYDLNTDSLGLLLGATALDEFMQVVGTYDVSAGSMELFINGTSIGTATPGGGDWSGGDAAGICARGDSNVGGIGGGQQATEGFDGQIAIFNLYRNQILTPAEVLANFTEKTSADDIPPTYLSLTPPNLTPDFFAGFNLSATFTEDIALTGTGSITIDNLDGGTDIVISLPDPQVTVSGNTLTIDPTSSLDNDTDYAVLISSDAIVDTAAVPNAFAGISDPTRWTFTTLPLDTTPPVATAFSPADDSTDVSAFLPIQVTFDEDIQAGTGDITIRNLTDMTDTVIPVGDAQVSISGNVLTINATGGLPADKDVAVQIAPTAIENLTGLAYAGISDDVTWNFTTVPALLIYEPFADLDPSLNGNTAGLGLSGTWGPGESQVADGSLSYGALAKQGGRAVTNPGDEFDVNGVSPGNTLLDAGLMADGSELWFSVLIVKHADTSDSTDDRRTYFTLGTGTPDGFDRIGGNTGSGFGVAVNKSTNAVEARGWNDGSDGGGGAFSGGLDTSVPEGATFLAVGKITWGEFGVANDVLELYLPDLDLNLGTPVSTLNADFDQLGASNAANAFTTIGFAGGRPSNSVPEIDEIRFGASASAVLPIDGVDPLLVATNPVDDELGGNGIQQTATFDEPVFAGSGDIRIVNDTDVITTTITLPDPQVTFSGNTLTITPTVPLAGGKAYHIEIDAGAVTDYAGNPFAGISDPTAWNFTIDGTPPTLTSITDSVSPNPVLTNSGLVYTVTFSEAIDPSTVEIADFANGGSAPITIDSVSATGDPAVFEVVVSTDATPGDLTLEIVQNAVITDISGNALDTSAALPDDTTIPVNAPVATAASIVADFQGIIGSELNANGTGEARYFHVSVNPANPGTGWYCADLLDGTDGPPGFRNYGGDVVAYKFLGGTNNSITGVTGSGGEPDRISYTTEDAGFDGFGQQQLRLWANNDPGPDLATGAGLAATGFDSIGNFGYRSFGGAVGTIDISGLASGSLHIYYGAFSAVPSVKVTLKDTDNVAADIVLADAHLNGDNANRTEYYLAEIDFVTDGFYDVIEFEWLANGTNYDGNGRGLGCVLTGPEPLDDYATWSEQFAPADLTDPDADLDGDGLTNNEERLFGLDPTDPSSQNPYTVGLDAGAGTFTFTRRDPSLTGLFTDIETSTDLQNWTVDSGAALVVTGPDANGVESVAVTLSAALLTNPELYVRVNLNDGTVYSEDFEAGDGGYTATGTPNDWAYGTPNSNNDFNLVLTTGNNSSTGAWGTNLGDGSVPSGLIDNIADSILRSPDIDLTGVAGGANLSFAAAIDAQTGDAVQVIVRNAADDTALATLDIVDTSGSAVTADWDSYGPFDISAGAGLNVYLEFRFAGSDAAFIGLYVDDVNIAQTP